MMVQCYFYGLPFGKFKNAQYDGMRESKIYSNPKAFAFSGVQKSTLLGVQTYAMKILPGGLNLHTIFSMILSKMMERSSSEQELQRKKTLFLNTP